MDNHITNENCKHCGYPYSTKLKDLEKNISCDIDGWE